VSPKGFFHVVARSVISSGALESKTKELIVLAIGIAARCDYCLAYHSKAAAKYGASQEEVMETIWCRGLHGRRPVDDLWS